ncbi:dynein light chain Tctex-type protein 2B-like [Lineus longissimus]|uniref:dynein light chain Tctex-type protein 2B-like n=1 Tax=Lineus longissimus TaxID=88925 RepID=UPI002B4E04DA
MHRGVDSFRKQSSVGSGIESARGQTRKPGESVLSSTTRKVSTPASGKRRQRLDSTSESHSERMRKASSTGQPPAQGVPTFRKKSQAAGAQKAESPVAQRPTWAGPSLMGLMAGKKFAKKWASRFSTNRKAASSESGQTWNSATNAMRLEPTYRMEPHKRFNDKKVEAVIKENLEQRLEGFKYTPRLGPMMSKILTEEIKESVKALCFDRYKIIVSVTMGEKKNQGLRLSSRCTWDEHLDSFATYVFENSDIFCSVTVYGVYFE